MAETRLLVVQHQDDCPPAWMGDWLGEAGCRLDVRRPYAGDDLPGDLADHDGLMVLGGSMGAGDDDRHPWLAPTRALVRDAAERGTPALGICLGHQLAAVALGGRSERNPHGQQLGLVEMGWTDPAGDDPLAQPLLTTGHGVFWNNDVVVEPPAGTVVLARAASGELQMARFAPTVWGVQLHPEVDAGILAAWAEEDRSRYDEGVLEDALHRVDRARETLAAGWRPLATRFAKVASGVTL